MKSISNHHYSSIALRDCQTFLSVKERRKKAKKKIKCGKIVTKDARNHA